MSSQYSGTMDGLEGSRRLKINSTVSRCSAGLRSGIVILSDKIAGKNLEI